MPGCMNDAPYLGAAFAAEVAKTANRHRAWPRRFFSPLASAMLSPEQRWRRRITIGLGSLVVAVVVAVLPAVRAATKPGSTTVHEIQTVIGQRWAPIILFALIALAIWRKVFAAAQATARFVDDPKSEAADGSMQQVHEQLGKLIRQAVRNPGPFGCWLKRVWPTAARLFPRLRGRRRLVLVVDDLERCRPPRGVEVCEVASQLLGHPDVMTILVADMSTVATSAEIKYSQLEIFSNQSKNGTASPHLAKGAYGRAYLQKMVQLQFDVPPANLANVQHMLSSDINGPVNPQNNDAFRDAEKGGLSGEARPHKTDNVNLLRRTSNWISAIAVTVAAGVVVGVVTPLLSHSTTSNTTNNSSPWVLLGAVAGGLGIVASVAWGLVPLLLNRRRQRSQRIDEEIKSRAADTDSVESLKAAVLDSEAARQGGRGLAGQRFERFVADDSILRQQAESEILKFLPSVPRSAKRLANHLRLLLVVASERKMLGGEPPLEATHLGKWAVLLERWPELGFAIRTNPALLANMEKMARTDPQALIEQIRTFSSTAADLADYTEFFKSEPTLAAVLLRLIYCLPAVVTADEIPPATTGTTSDATTFAARG